MRGFSLPLFPDCITVVPVTVNHMVEVRILVGKPVLVSRPDTLSGTELKWVRKPGAEFLRARTFASIA